MYERHIFIFIIIVECIKNAVDGSCEISLKSMTVVKSCPSNKTEMEESSERKNCSQYIDEDLEKNCVDYKKDKTFKYHCVLNEDGDKLIEVCAPERVIKGFCAEYNVKKNGRIQGLVHLECTGYNPPCEYYKSSTAYLYQDCYNLTMNVKLIQDNKYGNFATVTSKTVPESSTLTSKGSLASPALSRKQDWWVVLGTCISIVILIIIVALFLVLCFCNLPSLCVKKESVTAGPPQPRGRDDGYQMVPLNGNSNHRTDPRN